MSDTLKITSIATFSVFTALMVACFIIPDPQMMLAGCIFLFPALWPPAVLLKALIKDGAVRRKRHLVCMTIFLTLALLFTYLGTQNDGWVLVGLYFLYLPFTAVILIFLRLVKVF